MFEVNEHDSSDNQILLVRQRVAGTSVGCALKCCCCELGWVKVCLHFNPTLSLSQ